MCTGATIGLALLATSIVAQGGTAAIQAESARKRRSQIDSDLAKGIQAQNENQRTAQELLLEQIGGFDATNRDDQRFILEDETTGRLRDLILPTADQVPVTSQVKGNVSPLYDERANTAVNDENVRLGKLTDLLGKLEGPYQLRRNESYRFADYSTKLAELLRQNQSTSEQAALKAQGRRISTGSQVGAGLLSALGQGAALGAGFSAGGGGLATAKPAPTTILV